MFTSTREWRRLVTATRRFGDNLETRKFTYRTKSLLGNTLRTNLFPVRFPLPNSAPSGANSCK
jgi:hypothetical protein